MLVPLMHVRGLWPTLLPQKPTLGILDKADTFHLGEDVFLILHKAAWVDKDGNTSTVDGGGGGGGGCSCSQPS